MEIYRGPDTSKFLTKFLNNVFFYRLLIVLIAGLTTCIVGGFVWHQSDAADKLKNFSLVLTGGSIIIGIFYSIINYEHNKSKFHHDVRSSRDLLTFTTACKMHDLQMIMHFRTAQEFHKKHEKLFQNAKHSAILEKLEEDANVKSAFVVVFNYLETIAIAIEQGLINEEFMREFFAPIFRDNYGRWGKFFEHLRTVRKSPKLFKPFSDLAVKWTNMGV